MRYTSAHSAGSIHAPGMPEQLRTSGLVDSVVHTAHEEPRRVICTFRNRSLTYSDLARVIEMMVPVTRSQQMDDRAAIVAATFSAMPLLSAERDPAVVAAVIDGLFARIIADLDRARVAPIRAPRTNEIDLRGIASRLAAS